MKFCSTRWVKDQPVVDGALEVWPSVVSTVKHWLGLSKSSDTLVEHHQDVLIPAKFNFFH